jgi:transcriptional regulator with XRE-family HTH domain
MRTLFTKATKKGVSMAEDKKFAKKLISFRLDIGLSLEELARKTGLTVSDLHDYESGKYEIPASAAFIIAYSLGLDPDVFLSDDEDGTTGGGRIPSRF